MISRILCVQMIVFLWVFTCLSAQGVHFKPEKFSYPVPINVVFQLDLKDLLQEYDRNETLNWIPENKPSWLTFDPLTHTLAGSPSSDDTGRAKFELQVEQRGSTDSVELELVVYTEPKWRSSRIDLGEQWATKSFQYDLHTAVNNPDGGVLRFYAQGMPNWMSLNTEGILSGTPGHGDVGSYYGIFLQVTGPYNSTDETEGFGKVNKVPIAPKWKTNPLVLVDAQEDALYEQSLSNYVINPDGLALSFTFAEDYDAPSWLNMTNVGKMFGVPRRHHIGKIEAKVLFKTTFEGEEHIERTTCHFEVKWVNKSPRWLKDPLPLPTAYSDQAYSQDLSEHVEDPDIPFGDLLQFEIVGGPRWASVDAKGLFKGTPSVADIGEYLWDIKVIDANGASDESRVWVKVVKGNKAPVIKPDILFTVKERESFIVNLDNEKYVVDSDGDKLTFSLVGTVPSWAVLGEDGSLSLKPVREHIGQHSFGLQVKDSKHSVEGTFKVVVVRSPRPPIWLKDPIQFEATAGEMFSQSIAELAKDLDGMSMAFEKASGPDWLAISPAGFLSGVPRDANSGENTFRVTAKNSDMGADATVAIEVKFGNRPPRWLEDPIRLGDAKPGALLVFDLKAKAQDVDGDPMTFKKVMGPGWLGVASNGQMTGTPSESDMGPFLAIVEVTDGNHQGVQAGVKGTVVSGNSPPVFHGEKLSFSVKENKTFQENLNQSKYVEDPDGDRLSFSLLTSVSWVSLNSSGALDLSPQHAHVGNHNFRIEVSDGKHKVEAMMFVKVVSDPKLPIWLQDPIQFVTLVNQLFEVDISDKAKDLNGAPLTFTKESGPDWLMVSSSGKLSGLPGQINTGQNIFKLGATNSVGTAHAFVILTVRPSLDEERIQLDTFTPGSRTEILWVIDNSGDTSKYISSLGQGVSGFYSNLRGQIIHSAAMVSAREWAGMPIRGSNGSYLLKSSDPDISRDFRQRVDYAWNSEVMNSPVWSMHKFYNRVKNISELYHKGYFTVDSPMEVFIFTAQDDHFKNLSVGTSQSGWNIYDYERAFSSFHTKEGQPFTITAMDLRCPSPFDPNNPSGHRPPYLALTLNTLGIYYHHSPECDDRVITALSTYAYSVSLRANVFAKKRIKLKGHPFSSTSVKVSLYHYKKIPLTGNTGSSQDQWYYDADTNEIIMQWYLIDTPINRGDELVIEY